MRSWLVNALVILAVVFIAATAYARSGARIDAVATETHVALCAFKHDLQARRYRSWEFRESGRTVPGITRGDINRSLSQQGQTLAALAALSCD